MELRHIWLILWKRKLIIIQSFVIVTLIAVVGSEFAPKIYEARAYIWVPRETSQSTLLSLFGLKALSSTYPGGRGVKEEMRNRRLLASLFSNYKDVVWKLQLRTPEGDLINPRFLKVKRPFYSLHPHPVVDIRIPKDVAFLKVTGTSTDAKEAQMLANAMAGTYLRNNERMLRNETRVGRAFVKKQMEEVSELYDQVLDEYLEFQESEETVNLPLETQIEIRRVTELITDRERTIMRINEAEVNLVGARKRLDTQTLALWAEASGVLTGDPELTRLTTQWTQAKIKLRNALIEKTEDHPLMDILKKEVKNFEEELRERLELYEVFSPLVIGYKRDLVSLQTRLENLERDIEVHMGELDKLPEKALDAARLTLKVSSFRSIYSSLLDYDKQLGLAEAISLEDVKIVEEAFVPRGPVLPNKTRNRNLGMIFGLVIGVALAFLVENLDDRFITPEDVREREKLPMLGVIPVIRGRQISPSNAEDGVVESYRVLRHNLKGLLGGRSPRSLAVLSAASGEGRSITAANIALSFCKEGKNVVLLDADLRNPSQHRIFGTERSPGVEEVLAGAADIEGALKGTGIEGLKLLPSGGGGKDPAARIESREMAQLVEELERRFDVIISDTPPLLCVADGVIIAGMMETSIIVYESRRTTAKMADLAKQSLERARVVPAGVILNKFRVDRFAFRTYGYEKS